MKSRLGYIHLLITCIFFIAIASCSSEARTNVHKNQKIVFPGFENITDQPYTAAYNTIKGKIKLAKKYNYKYAELQPNVSMFDTGVKHMYSKIFSDSVVSYYNVNGTLDSQFKYDSSGEQIEKLLYYYKDNKPDKWDFSFSNYKDNETTLFQYDQKGNLVEAITKSYNSEKAKKSTFVYDKHRNIIKEICLFYRNGIKIIKESKYDENDNQTELTLSSPLFTFKIRNKATYDKKGNKISSEENSINGKKSMSKISNNTMGRPVTVEDYDDQGKLFAKITYQYDNWGNTSKFILYLFDSKDTSISGNIYKYDYDSIGNVKKMEESMLLLGTQIPESYCESVYYYYK